MTENDRLFLQAVQRAHSPQRTVVTNRLLLSEELLELFEVDKNSPGFWCFGIYVELEPAFKLKEPEPYQKKRIL